MRFLRSRTGVALFSLTVATAATPADLPTNGLGDPFLQVTGAIAGCTLPPDPPLSEAELKAEAHSRTERGTSCFQSGRCRLPNAYMYDKEIIPRVRQAILADGRFSGTSIWIEGRRRWVWLKGCVRTRAEAQALSKLVRNIDDVEAVIDELVVKQR
jgi:BON domain